jgi:hypothetical protein
MNLFEFHARELLAPGVTGAPTVLGAGGHDRQPTVVARVASSRVLYVLSLKPGGSRRSASVKNLNRE